MAVLLFPLIGEVLGLSLDGLLEVELLGTGCHAFGSLLWTIFPARSAVIVDLIIGGGSLVICSC